MEQTQTDILQFKRPLGTKKLKSRRAEGSVIKRGENVYRIKYDMKPDPVTRERRTAYETHHGSEASAYRLLRKRITEAEGSKSLNLSKRTLGEWLEQWLEIHKPNVREKTHERYCQLLRIHVIPYIGEIPLKDVRLENIESLYAKLRKKGLIPQGKNGTPRGLGETTLSHVHRAFSKAMSKALSYEYIDKNVCIYAEAPKPKDPHSVTNKEKIYALDRNQLDDLFSKIESDDLFPIVFIACATGARRNEIIGCKRTDFDPEKGTLRIERAVNQTKKNGLVIGDTKNSKSRRTIKIDEDTINELKAHIKDQDEISMRIGKSMPDNALIFPKSISKPNEIMTPHNVTRRFNTLAKNAGLPGLKFHSLRHTHASLLLSEGVPVNAVSARLGHASAMITMTVYSHLLKKAEDEAASVAASFMKSAFSSRKKQT